MFVHRIASTSKQQPLTILCKRLSTSAPVSRRNTLLNKNDLAVEGVNDFAVLKKQTEKLKKTGNRGREDIDIFWQDLPVQGVDLVPRIFRYDVDQMHPSPFQKLLLSFGPLKGLAMLFSEPGIRRNLHALYTAYTAGLLKRRWKNQFANWSTVINLTRWNCVPLLAEEIPRNYWWRHPLKYYRPKNQLNLLQPLIDRAMSQYQEIHAAIARRDGVALRAQTGGRYLEAKLAALGTRPSGDPSAAVHWQLERFSCPPVLMSIRAVDPYSQNEKEVAEKVAINAIFKFDTIQKLSASPHFQRSGKGRRRAAAQEGTSSRPRRVVEYLVMDIRPWLEGTPSRFVMEIFDGQDITFETIGAPNEKTDETVSPSPSS